MRGLEGKVAMVAGGAGRIGTATSVRLSEEGMSVVVGDRDGAAAEAVAKDIVDRGGSAAAVQCDITDAASVAAMVRAAHDAFGRIDSMHANAADLSCVALDTDAVDISLDVYDRTMDANLRGHLLCTRHVVPHLLETGGSVVYTSSGAAFMGEPYWPAYAISKSGLHALVRHVASRWGRDGVRANAVAPGMVVTGGSPVLAEEQHRILTATPSTRLGRPEDIAAAVAFLLSDDGGWINGQVLSVDGGLTMR